MQYKFDDLCKTNLFHNGGRRTEKRPFLDVLIVIY